MNRYEQGLELLEKIDGKHGEAVIESLKEVSPDLANYIVEFAFGEIYSRKTLDLKQKQLVTIASLLSQGGCEDQLYIHLTAALNVGLSPAEVLGAIIHCIPYTGFPKVLNAVKVLKKVYEQYDTKTVDKEKSEGKAIVLVTMTNNPAELESLNEYKSVAKKVRDENGARVLFSGELNNDVIGYSSGKSIRILEFPSEAAVFNWLNDPRYMAVIPLREKAFTNLSLNILQS